MFSSQGSQVASSSANYIEDVFSTWLYTGNGGGSATGFYGTQTITNGIDLSTKGGLVWVKSRSAVEFHRLADTARGVNKLLSSNSTSAEQTGANTITAFNTTGFNLGSDSDGYGTNTNAVTYASWTFRKQPKFFDVVTVSHTNGVADTVDLSGLGTVGCVIVKCTSASDDWYVWHRGCSAGNIIRLNLTDAQYSSTKLSVSGTTLTISSVFATGTYVVYAYAHNAGGFGLTGTDNVISCGSYTGSDSTTTTVTLGYEPQWIMIKRATGDTSAYTGWAIFDNMRGMPVSGNDNTLLANTSDAENPVTANGAFVSPTATGFTLNVAGSNLTNTTNTYIYIAIRRGPMKVPTSGTSVFSPVAYSGTGATRTITAGFPVDLAIPKSRGATGNGAEWYSRLIGPNRTMLSSGTFAEFAIANELTSFASNTGVVLGSSSTSGGTNASGSTYVDWNIARAPSFFDEVCYTGNGASNNAKTHNLGVAPELLIIKNRSSSASGDWYTFHTFTSSNFKKQLLDTTDAQTNYTYGSFLDAQPTSTTFTVNSGAGCNESGVTYVSYLFATCAGVSKVGSYTGNGTTQTINCGFTGGARFVLIKRTDSTGDWYVYDTARGMTTLTDPYLLMNTTGAEVATLGSVTSVSTGFALNSTILAAINASGGTYIFLAIA